MRKGIFILFFTFLTISFEAYSQLIEKFSLDSTDFNNEIKLFFRNAPDKERLIIEKFMQLWNTKIFGKDEYIRIQKNLNQQLTLNLKPIPDYTNYFLLMISFIEQNNRPDQIKKWQEGFYELLITEKLRISLIKNYIRFSVDFINKKYLYNSQAIKWRSSSENYQFYFDKAPIIKIFNTTLTCYAKRDSIHIFQTNGTLYPLENKWIGKEGVVSWNRSEYPIDSVNAKLNNYTLFTNKSEYHADSVIFTNLYYFSIPVSGSLIDKVTATKSAQSVLYPQFTAFDNNYHWTNMYPNIDYDGGFSFQGSRIVGHTDTNDDVMLSLRYHDTLLLRMRSENIIFLPKRVLSNRSKLTMYIDNDSIYHPNLSFTYFVDRHEIIFTKNDDFLSQSAYLNTYHQVLMNFEQIEWKLRDAFMSFTMIKSSAIGNANFKSLNFYNLYDYQKHQGMDETHPLIVIRKYNRKTKSNTFNAIDYAHYINKPINQTRQLLLRLTVEGYIRYSPDNDEVIILNKLHSVLAARYGKTDYDVMNIKSTTNRPIENAILNLNNKDLSINGIDRIFLSDSQQVAIYPEGGKITMKKNRDFSFDGVVVAGLFTFFGNGFYFSYDKFNIELENVDSLRMKAQTDERNMYNQPILMRVNNTIENITGEILIDNPNNKSGLGSLSQYPIFKSKKNSFIYYDDEYIQSGLYKRDNFYFEIYPYTLDSLDNFNREGLVFDGYFVSADIFPPFEEQVYIMQDNSLGFIRSTPDDGFPLYKGKGEYYDKINLSNQGLRGKGKITYLTSTILSEDYVFLPDSMNTLATNFSIAKQKTGIGYPYLQGKNIEIHWEPFNDVLYSQQTTNPFKIYNDNTTLEGSIKLKPTGLTGSGNMNFENALFTSNYYTYDADDFVADSANFTLYTPTKDTTVFVSANLQARYNFLNKTGDFKTIDDIIKVDFPANQYIAYIDNFQWKGRENMIKMTTQNLVHIIEQGVPKVVPIEQRGSNPIGNHFISVHPLQDSLDFVSPTAQFNIGTRKIIADAVALIKVADSYIYPFNKYVEVNERARMTTLERAEILATRESKKYKFYNAKVNIRGKYSYSGSGDYDYIDVYSVPQRIHFDKIFVDDSIQTVAQGKVKSFDNFYLSPRFAFQGSVFLYANEEFLTFKGITQINHQCEIQPTNWIRFEGEINPKSIFIPYPVKPKDKNGDMLFSGDFITNDSIHIYTAFLSKRKVYSDNLITPANGYLHYDKSRGEYIIASKTKITNRDTTGNLISLSKDICIFHGEGDINLGVNFHHFKVDQIGSVNHDLEKKRVNLDLIMTLDFYFSNPALDIMAMDLDSLPGNEAINMTGKLFNKKMNELIGIEKANSLKEDLLLYGSYRRLPSEFDKSIVFTHLNLRWNPETRSYRSVGKIGIASVGKRQIHKLFEGNLEIVKRRSGDAFHLYLKIDKKNWYYLSYTRGVLQSLSSNNIYNTILEETKPKDRKLKGSGSQPYVYILATENNYRRTIARFGDTESEKKKEEEIEYID